MAAGLRGEQGFGQIVTRWSLKIAIVAIGTALLSACVSTPAFDLANEGELRADIAWLADDARMGREPGSPAEADIRAYAVERMQSIGLVPAFPGKSWTQPVIMAHRAPMNADATFRRGKRDFPLGANQFEYSGEQAQSIVAGAPLVFLGELVPDSMATRDFGGDMLLMMQPGSSALQAERLNAARKAGAAGLITIVDSDARFERIAQRMQRPGFFLPGGVALGRAGEAPEFYNAVMSEQAAVRLTGASGLDWDTLRRDGRTDGYEGVRLGVTLDLDWRATIEERPSANIAGLSKGTKPGSGALLFLAHWDHLGMCAEDASGQPLVCPGAIDNASGVAALWQIAEKLSAERHDRDIYFLLTSGEEEGFVGAHSFVAAPPVPPYGWHAIFNLDMIAIGPGGPTVAVIGWQDNAHDAEIDGVLATLGLRRSLSSLPGDYLKRQDGWVFQQQGLPARMVNSAFGNDRRLNDFIESGYHHHSDGYDPMMELGAAAQDIALHIALGRHFADTKASPGD